MVQKKPEKKLVVIGKESNLPHFTFVTGNLNKVAEVSHCLQGIAVVDHESVDLMELQAASSSDVTRLKAIEAFRKLKRPVVVEDTSLVFNALKTLPGPYIKWFKEALWT